MTANYEIRQTLLKVENVSLNLGGNQILKDLSLEIRNLHRPGLATGQVVGLLGPSGIGKTRLFRILAGLDQPDSGSVLVGENGQAVKKGMIGVVAQSYPLFQHRTVMGNLLIAGKRAGLARSEAMDKAQGYLQRFQLTDRAHLYPSQLSGGQRQRVAIAQQFMCSEHFLLMDEPFSGLDLVAVDRVCELISEVASADDLNTIIVVTHDIVAALEVSDTILLLGRDRDSAGNIIPGSRIQKSFDLIARNLAWRDGITSAPEFLATLREIREQFSLL
jgi:polar amino acid transport system ATP-binding protein/sulfate transport system ATP-binding protein